MQSTIIPPRTVMEVFDLLPEGTRAEVIENNLVMSPAPSFQHQTILTKISARIFSYLERNSIGTVCVAPLDVFVNENTVLQPDIIVILNHHLHFAKKDGVHGAPDLVIEILSEGTKGNDLSLKKTIYGKFGVTEYWIIDPETKEAMGFTLAANKLIEFSRATGKIDSPVLKTVIEF